GRDPKRRDALHDREVEELEELVHQQHPRENAQAEQEDGQEEPQEIPRQDRHVSFYKFYNRPMTERPLLQPLSYADSHNADFVNDLKELVKIPSVSFPGFDPKHVEASAQAVAALMKARGIENVEILKLPGAHPYVYGDWLHAGPS